jgi:hypothetical protein
LIFIPIFGYKAALFSLIISYWSQMFIPLLNSYFKKITEIWLGNINKLVLLFILLLSTVIITIFVADLNLYIKLMFSFSIVTILLLLIKNIKSYSVKENM